MVANLDRSAIRPYKRARMPLPADNAIATPQEVLHDKLTALVDSALDQMLETGTASPALMRLVADATATLAALDAHRQFPARNRDHD
jgi:hypothetical protein